MSTDPATNGPLRIVDRYALYDAVASGGMATVHLGRLLGPVGFARTVAIKRLHPQFAHDPEFVAMFLDEARMAARIRHPNVVPTLDVLARDGEIFLVMEYVQGESLSALLRAARLANAPMPPSVLVNIMAGALAGLHAAHESCNERGELLGLVHRDVSPQNVLVGVDGVARVIDFGVAKAIGRASATREGQVKGKLAYMAPEQVMGQDIDRRSDIFSAGVMLWEALTGTRLYRGASDPEILYKLLEAKTSAPSAVASGSPPSLDPVVLRAMAKDPADRFATAADMAVAIQKAVPLVTTSEVADWVRGHAGTQLESRARRLQEIESSSSSDVRLEAAKPAATTLPPPSPLHDPTLAGALPSPAARHGTRLVVAGAIAAGALSLAAVYFFRAPKPATDPPAVLAAPAPPSEVAAASAAAQEPTASLLVALSPAPSATGSSVVKAPAPAASSVGRPAAVAGARQAPRDPGKKTSPKAPSVDELLGRH